MGIQQDRKNQAGSTPGWLHDCETVGHEVWTIQGATCAFCGAFNKASRTIRERGDT